jgi:hypothetical protein
MARSLTASRSRRGSHQIGLVATSVVSLTVPTGVNLAFVQADGENIRFHLDGTAPTTTSGFLIPKIFRAN